MLTCKLIIVQLAIILIIINKKLMQHQACNKVSKGGSAIFSVVTCGVARSELWWYHNEMIDVHHNQQKKPA